MPIYEYRCKGCQVVFSVLTRMEQRNDVQTCPNCGGRDTAPVMSATRTDFKFADRSAIKRVRVPKEGMR